MCGWGCEGSCGEWMCACVDVGVSVHVWKERVCKYGV